MKLATRLTVFAVLLALVAFCAGPVVWKVQGPTGPTLALRPPTEDLAALCRIPELGDRVEVARRLANAGAIIDVPVDVWCWDYEKAMAQRRLYGYKWVPSALMPPGSAAPNVQPQGPLQWRDPALSGKAEGEVGWFEAEHLDDIGVHTRRY
jgi:hypothetical protein